MAEIAVRLSASVPGGSQLTVTSAPGNPTPPSCVVTCTQMHISIILKIINLRNKKPKNLGAGFQIIADITSYC